MTFQVIDRPDRRIVKKYRDRLPNGIIDVWNEYGFGTFMEGFIKIINPDNYIELLEESYIQKYEDPIVMFATGMGDLIIWENNYTVQIDYRHGTSRVLESGFKYFIDDLSDQEFLEEELKWWPFQEAKKKLGNLNYDECYGYVPILAAGGAEKVENLEKVKIKEHISIISQIAGKIE